MRVLFIMNTFPPAYTGGAEISAYHTCRGLLREGINCSVLVVNNRSREPINEWYELDGIPVHRVNFYTHWRPVWRDIFDGRIYQAVKAELRHLKPDLVHVHNVSGATLAPYLACRRLNVPVVNTLHDEWLLCPNNMLYQHDGTFCDPLHPNDCHHLGYKCFRQYDYWGAIPYRRAVFAALTANVKAFLVPSQALIDVHHHAGYDLSRLRLVRLGFELPTPEEPTHPKIREIISTAHQYQTIVFAGGGNETKGAKVLLQAIPAMLDKVERLQVIIAGSGDERFLNLFHQYDPAVQILGQVPFKDMRALFAIADLVLIPSIWLENSPVVIFESFQVGTPIIGSAFGGIPEFIQEGKTGYLFPKGDAVALSQKIISHFQRPAHERRRMRQQCVKYIRTLTLENHLKNLQQVYHEVLAN